MIISGFTNNVQKVKANPELEGGEYLLTGLEVDGAKYAVPEGALCIYLDWYPLGHAERLDDMTEGFEQIIDLLDTVNDGKEIYVTFDNSVVYQVYCYKMFKQDFNTYDYLVRFATGGSIIFTPWGNDPDVFEVKGYRYNIFGELPEGIIPLDSLYDHGFLCKSGDLTLDTDGNDLYDWISILSIMQLPEFEFVLKDGNTTVKYESSFFTISNELGSVEWSNPQVHNTDLDEWLTPDYDVVDAETVYNWLDGNYDDIKMNANSSIYEVQSDFNQLDGISNVFLSGLASYNHGIQVSDTTNIQALQDYLANYYGASLVFEWPVNYVKAAIYAWEDQDVSNIEIYFYNESESYIDIFIYNNGNNNYALIDYYVSADYFYEVWDYIDSPLKDFSSYGSLPNDQWYITIPVYYYDQPAILQFTNLKDESEPRNIGAELFLNNDIPISVEYCGTVGSFSNICAFPVYMPDFLYNNEFQFILTYEDILCDSSTTEVEEDVQGDYGLINGWLDLGAKYSGSEMQMYVSDGTLYYETNKCRVHFENIECYDNNDQLVEYSPENAAQVYAYPNNYYFKATKVIDFVVGEGGGSSSDIPTGGEVGQVLSIVSKGLGKKAVLPWEQPGVVHFDITKSKEEVMSIINDAIVISYGTVGQTEIYLLAEGVSDGGFNFVDSVLHIQDFGSDRMKIIYEDGTVYGQILFTDTYGWDPEFNGTINISDYTPVDESLVEQELHDCTIECANVLKDLIYIEGGASGKNTLGWIDGIPTGGEEGQVLGLETSKVSTITPVFPTVQVDKIIFDTTKTVEEVCAMIDEYVDVMAQHGFLDQSVFYNIEVTGQGTYGSDFGKYKEDPESSDYTYFIYLPISKDDAFSYNGTEGGWNPEFTGEWEIPADAEVWSVAAYEKDYYEGVVDDLNTLAEKYKDFFYVEKTEEKLKPTWVDQSSGNDDYIHLASVPNYKEVNGSRIPLAEPDYIRSIFLNQPSAVLDQIDTAIFNGEFPVCIKDSYDNIFTTNDGQYWAGIMAATGNNFEFSVDQSGIDYIMDATELAVEYPLVRAIHISTDIEEEEAIIRPVENIREVWYSINGSLPTIHNPVISYYDIENVLDYYGLTLETIEIEIVTEYSNTYYPYSLGDQYIIPLMYENADSQYPSTFEINISIINPNVPIE